MYTVKKQLTLSIIIPAYNEEHYIRSCLDSIAQQTIMPDEVILVDNNCTDDTVNIANEYGFVKVVTEGDQGRGHARTKGFNSTTCDIIGRIDVDSVLAPDWCERVFQTFSSSDVGGVTGLAMIAALPRIQRPRTRLWSWMYTLWSRAENGFDLMWGANMAIRRDVWLKVRSGVCDDDQIVHEDQDISFLVLAAGERIRRDSRLLMNTDGQTFHYFPKLAHYTRLRYTTRARHTRSGGYKNIPKTVSPLWRFFALAVSPLVFIPFFVVSLLLWPLDIIIHRIGRTIFRTTS